MKNVLIASDHVMMGTMGMRAMTPYLEASGFRVAELPTGLVSNNFAYGKYTLKEETAFLAETLTNWKTLGFQFHALISGFIFSQEQVDILTRYGSENPDLYWVHDPIMGDYGDFYKGMNPDIANWHLKMAQAADVTVPNITEAQLILGKDVTLDLDQGAKRDLLQALYDATGKDWVVTSVPAEDPRFGEIWLVEKGTIKHLTYEKVPRHMVGTGDMFATFYTMCHLKDGDMYTSATFASNAVKALLMHLTEDAGMLGAIPHRGMMDVLAPFLGSFKNSR